MEPDLSKARKLIRRPGSYQIDIIDNDSSSGSDPFASLNSEQDDGVLERQRRIASAMGDDGPASWSLERCKDRGMLKQ